MRESALDSELYRLAQALGEKLKSQGLMLACAESCTGGWIGEVVTAVPGSSEWFERGFITYSNAAKQEMLGVQAPTLQAHGAVSEQVVLEMAAGALAHSAAHIAVSVSGVAGPGGGTAAKPVGMVCVGWCIEQREPCAATYRFAGDREAIRRQAVLQALHGVLKILDGKANAGSLVGD
jgi:nicotinamide-nucleotide amidase